MTGSDDDHEPPIPPRPSFRERWLSGRAVALHAGLVLIVGGCALAGWWQVTRALGGNSLSWFYSIEWPIFAVLALWGWWHLIHEDPADRAARKAPSPVPALPAPLGPAAGTLPGEGPVPRAPVRRETARLAGVLAAATGLDLVLGFVTVFIVPFNRPSGWLPTTGSAVYVAHASLGLVLFAGAAGYVVWSRSASRRLRIVAWLGAVGLTIACLGGLMTVARSLPRFLGMALMALGSVAAGCAYLIPFIARAPSRAASA